MRIHRLAVIVLVLVTTSAVLGSVVLLTPAAVKANFPFSRNVKVNTDTGTGSQETPVIGIDLSGNFYVAWADSRNGDFDIYFAKSTDKGNSWTDPNVRVNTDAAGTSHTQPSLAVDSGANLYLVWTDNRNGNSDIYFAKSVDGGMSWTDPNVKINTDAGTASQYEPSVAVDSSGVLYVVWTDERNVSSWKDVYLAKSTDGGITWSDPNIRVNSFGSASYQERPSLALASGNRVFVAWMDSRNAAWSLDTYFAASFNGGLTWPGPDVRVNSDTGNDMQRSPSLASDASGSAYVVWEDERNGGFDIYMAKSTDNGANWTDPNVRVNTQDHLELDADITIDLAGNVYVAWWTTGIMRSDDVMLGVSYDGGATFAGPDYQVDDAAGAQWFPRIVVDSGGTVSMVWQDSRNPSWDIYFATLGSLAVNPAVEGFSASTPGIGHIISHQPLFNFTYNSNQARPMAEFNVSVWDSALTTWLWGCRQTPPTPLPSGSNVTVRYMTAPCPTGGPPLVDGTTYKLWINVVDVGGVGSPATVLEFHMNEVLSPVAPVSPLDDSLVLCSTSQTVQWNPPGYDAEGEFVTSYSWQVATDVAFSNVIASGTWSTRWSTAFDTCPSGEFYWRVNMTDGWEWGAYGNQPDGYWNFTSYTPPPPNNPPVVVELHVDGFVSGSVDILHMTNHAPVFSWIFMDSDGDPQAAFEIRVGTSSGSSNMWAPGQNPSSMKVVTYLGATLLDGRNYYVGVRAFDSEDWSSWTTVRFRMNTPPSAPTLSTPANMSTDLAAGSVRLRWNTVVDGELDTVTYYWYVSESANFATIVMNGSTTTTSADISVVAGKTYYWRVQVRDDWEIGGMSLARTFTTAPPPPDSTATMSLLVILTFVVIAVVVVVSMLLVLMWKKAKRQWQQEQWSRQLMMQQQAQHEQRKQGGVG